jgi:hypothetical protein
MIFNDAIHVQAREGGENDNVKSIGISIVDDCLFAMHDV